MKFKNIVKFLESEQAKEDSNFTIKKYGTGILVIPNIGEDMASKPIWTKRQQEYLDERFNAIDKKFELVFKHFGIIFKHLGIEEK